jgi:hypothetical protein
MAPESRRGSTGSGVATMPVPPLDARTADLFAPDTLLPAQYFDRVRRRKNSTGEQRLMVAVLEQAVDDYMSLAGARDRVRRRMFADAERWMESTDASRLYSFETICDHVGLDVDYMRDGLRRWKARVRGEVTSSISPTEVEPGERRRASNE